VVNAATLLAAMLKECQPRPGALMHTRRNCRPISPNSGRQQIHPGFSRRSLRNNPDVVSLSFRSNSKLATGPVIKTKCVLPRATKPKGVLKVPR